MSTTEDRTTDYTTEPRRPFDLTQAEMNLILRLRQHHGMAIVDAGSMCLWTANKMEQCNGKRPRLPFDLEVA